MFQKNVVDKIKSRIVYSIFFS